MSFCMSKEKSKQSHIHQIHWQTNVVMTNFSASWTTTESVNSQQISLWAFSLDKMRDKSHKALKQTSYRKQIETDHFSYVNVLFFLKCLLKKKKKSPTKTVTVLYLQTPTMIKNCSMTKQVSVCAFLKYALTAPCIDVKRVKRSYYYSAIPLFFLKYIKCY